MYWADIIGPWHRAVRCWPHLRSGALHLNCESPSNCVFKLKPAVQVKQLQWYLKQCSYREQYNRQHQYLKKIWRHKNTVSKKNGCKEILIPSRMVSLAAAWRFPLRALSWISSDVFVQVIEVDLWLLFIEAGVVRRVWREHTGLHPCRLFEDFL